MKLYILKEHIDGKIVNKYDSPSIEIDITERTEMFNPLYEWLYNFFSDDYQKAANQFMFMGAEKPWKESKKTLYYYKHGMTRKYLVVDNQGTPFSINRENIKLDNIISSIEVMTYLASFKKVYGDLENNIKQVHGDSENPYFVSYNQDYIKKRTDFLNKKGVKTLSGTANQLKKQIGNENI